MSPPVRQPLEYSAHVAALAMSRLLAIAAACASISAAPGAWPGKIQLPQPSAGVAPPPLAPGPAGAAVVRAKPLTAADIKVKAAAAAASRRQGRCPSVDLGCGVGTPFGPPDGAGGGPAP